MITSPNESNGSRLGGSSYNIKKKSPNGPNSFTPMRMSNLKKDPSQKYMGKKTYQAGKLSNGKVEIIKQKVVNTGGLDVPSFAQQELETRINNKLDANERYQSDADGEVKYGDRASSRESPSKAYVVLGGKQQDPNASGSGQVANSQGGWAKEGDQGGQGQGSGGANGSDGQGASDGRYGGSGSGGNSGLLGHGDDGSNAQRLVAQAKFEAEEKKKRMKYQAEQQRKNNKKYHDKGGFGGAPAMGPGHTHVKGGHICYCRLKPNPDYDVPADQHSSDLNKGILMLREEEQRLLHERQMGQKHGYKNIPLDSNLQEIQDKMLGKRGNSMTGQEFALYQSHSKSVARLPGTLKGGPRNQLSHTGEYDNQYGSGGLPVIEERVPRSVMGGGAAKGRGGLTRQQKSQASGIGVYRQNEYEPTLSKSMSRDRSAAIIQSPYNAAGSVHDKRIKHTYSTKELPSSSLMIADEYEGSRLTIDHDAVDNSPRFRDHNQSAPSKQVFRNGRDGVYDNRSQERGTSAASRGVSRGLSQDRGYSVDDSPQKKARKALVEMHEYESKIQNRVKFMEREQNKYLRKIHQTRSEAAKMQQVREAKERAYKQIEESRLEKEKEELQVRGKIENKREFIQRQTLEGALNTRRTTDDGIQKEKEKREALRLYHQQEKNRELANKFRMAESIRQDKKNLKQSQFFNDQLKMLVARDDRASHAIEMNRKVNSKKDRVSKLEAMEHEMISSLQTTMNELQSVINQSQAGKLEKSAMRGAAQRRAIGLQTEWKH